MASKIDERVDEYVGKLPFFMVVMSWLIRGALFVMLNVPLIMVIANNRNFTNLYSLISNGVFSQWVSWTNAGSSLTSIASLLFVSLLVGLLLLPIERAIVAIVTVILSLPSYVFQGRLNRRLYGIRQGYLLKKDTVLFVKGQFLASFP